MRKPLAEVAKLIRSKNAGPFWLTFDVMFQDPELYRRVAPGVFVVSARAPVADLNERFGWNLPLGEYETVGGLVLDRLGRVPKPGDGVRAGRVRLEVTRASARAVLELRVAVG